MRYAKGFWNIMVTPSFSKKKMKKSYKFNGYKRPQKPRSKEIIIESWRTKKNLVCEVRNLMVLNGHLVLPFFTMLKSKRLGSFSRNPMGIKCGQTLIYLTKKWTYGGNLIMMICLIWVVKKIPINKLINHIFANNKCFTINCYRTSF